MGRQRNKPQTKGKKEASERMLNEIKASELWDTEFKTMIIRKLNELSLKNQKLLGNCEELSKNYISIKKDIEMTNKGQEEMKNMIFEIKTQ